MPCFHPLTAYRSAERNPASGKHLVTFSATKALIEGSMFKLPCGQCTGCRLDKAQQWAIRCKHEAQMHDRNCFVTLTYSDEHVPVDFSVKLRDWQLFNMRLRKAAGSGIKFFGGGEYSDFPMFRPHYHGVYFGYDFPDKRLRQRRNGHPVYTSELLSELWPYGSSEIGSVTYASAGYVARYAMKKVTGKRADDHYFRQSPIDGQMYRVEPEFCTMSRRPGLGSAWFDRFASDAFPCDFLVVEGRRVKPPASYLRKLEERAQVFIKRARKRASVQPQARANSTKERLAVREFITQDRVKRLARKL